MSEPHFWRRHWKLIFNLATVLALVLLVIALHEQIAQTIDNLSRVDAWALLLMIPLEFLNYDAITRMYRSLFAILGNPVAYREMFKVTLELTLVNQVFPSGGVSGFSYFSLRLKKLGISAGKATLVQTMQLIFLFISFEVLLILGLLSLAIGGNANNLTILVAGSLATLLVIATVGLAVIIGSRRRINSFLAFTTKFINRVIQVVRPKYPETINIAKAQHTFNELHENYMVLKNDYNLLRKPLLFAFIANVAEVAVIYVVYIAFGHWVNPGAIILAYGLANIAGLISVLPGGIGIYEAIMTAVLATAGVPAAVSLPVTIMYRVLNTTIQLIPGYYFYHKNLSQREAQA